jgi:hypothetical protein
MAKDKQTCFDLEQKVTRLQVREKILHKEIASLKTTIQYLCVCDFAPDHKWSDDDKMDVLDDL